VPFQCRAGERVDTGALRAGCCGGRAPEIVVDGVGAGDGRVPLAAVVCALLEGGCGGWGGEGEGG
jgi:hypothetical protein